MQKGNYRQVSCSWFSHHWENGVHVIFLTSPKGATRIPVWRVSLRETTSVCHGPTYPLHVCTAPTGALIKEAATAVGGQGAQEGHMWSGFKYQRGRQRGPCWCQVFHPPGPQHWRKMAVARQWFACRVGWLEVLWVTLVMPTSTVSPQIHAHPNPIRRCGLWGSGSLQSPDSRTGVSAL